MDVDALIVGGGPAGIAAASVLSTLGHRVLLVCGDSRPRVAESCPPSILSILELLNVRQEVEVAHCFHARRAMVHWGGRDRAVFEAGFVVDRRRLDAVLLKSAVRAGASVATRVRVSAPQRVSSGWRVRVGDQSVGARVLIDAAGRRGWLPGKRRRLSAPLLAVVASLQRAWSGPETVVEAVPDAWFWGMKLPTGENVVAAFVDPSVRGPTRPCAFRRLFERSSLLNGNIVGQLRLCAAGPVSAEQPVGEGWVRAGDAALAYDPLSAQGVAAALSGGFLAAVVTHTTLTTPENIAIAREFYRLRITESAELHVRNVGAHYAEQAAITATPFWQTRAFRSPPPNAPPSSPQPGERVGLQPGARVTSTPVLTGNLICEGLAVLVFDETRPIAFIAGTPIEEILPHIADRPLANELKDRLVVRFGRQGHEIYRGLFASQIAKPFALPENSSNSVETTG